MMTYGYMETPNIPRGLAILRKLGFKFDIMATSFFLSRRSIRPAAHSGMPLWQDKLFIALAKTASDATDFFQIPTGRVVEVGTQVTVYGRGLKRGALRPQLIPPTAPCGSASMWSRQAAAWAMRSVTALRRAPARRCSGASRRIAAPYASATMRPVLRGQDLGRKIGRRRRRTGGRRSSGTLAISRRARKSATLDFTSTIQISPSGPKRHDVGAAAVGQRQLGQAAKPCLARSRRAPRQTARAAADCRPSGGGERAMARAACMGVPRRILRDSRLGRESAPASAALGFSAGPPESSPRPSPRSSSSASWCCPT